MFNKQKEIVESHWEYQYLNLLKNLIRHGYQKPIYGHSNRHIKSMFGVQMRFNLAEYFPILTTKKVFWRGVVEELLWFIRGETNIKPLVDKGIHIWDEWAYKRYLRWMEIARPDIPVLSQNDFILRLQTDSTYYGFGELGAVYGRQWRKWIGSDGGERDQLAWALWKLKQPNQRERKHIVVSAWNPEHIYEMATPGNASELPPCHMIYQFNVQDDRLSCMLTIRSNDVYLGAPFNIASYALLTHIMAHLAGLKVGELVYSIGDAHIYDNHYEAANLQITRAPLGYAQLSISKREDLTLNNITSDDIILHDYISHPHIKADVTAVGGYDETNDYKA